MQIPNNVRPPYLAVIFSSKKKVDDPDFQQVSDRIDALVVNQDGYLGHETVGSDPSITISYWRDMESIKKWRNNPEHAQAMKTSIEKWFAYYHTKIAEVQSAHYWEAEN